MAQLPARRSARNITLVNPSREFEDIYDRMGQLMSMAFGDLAFTPALAAAWTPLADISETDDAYLVEVELPGVNKEQVNVDVNDRELVITGEIAEPQEERQAAPPPGPPHRALRVPHHSARRHRPAGGQRQPLRRDPHREGAQVRGRQAASRRDQRLTAAPPGGPGGAGGHSPGPRRGHRP